MDGPVQRAREQGLSGEPPPPPSSKAVALVLGDDDLLREVLLRVALPSSLVRAARVCRRWLRAASDPAFLRRFRGLHPPLLLGSFPSRRSVCTWPELAPRRGLAPELAAAARRVADYFAGLEIDARRFVRIQDVRNGSVLVRVAGVFGRQPRVAVCAPLLRPARPLAYLRVPGGPSLLPNFGLVRQFSRFLPEDGGDGLSFFEVSIALRGQAAVCAEFVACQAGVRRDGRRSAPIVLPAQYHSSPRRGLPVGDKFYTLFVLFDQHQLQGCILRLDLMAMTLFCINLPDEVEMEPDYHKKLVLSRAEDSKCYLIYVMGLQIRVWLHGTESDGNTSNWVLVDTVCLVQAFGPLAKPGWEEGGANIYLMEKGGDSAEFVYLSVNDEAYLLHIKSKTAEKVLENGEEPFHVHPFMMTWPPTFPEMERHT